ncbi:MAG TPA: MFS transporter [Phenylobacterium sp.]|uniref:MFS transporter n=1 Tax=Phenylobacterium sp. TaxID=1871053 RepID=UPI002B464698|nr:MFS transporter [Phenylobacterium sp.]HKR89760.1 MFS transporter [Phenylobacterium sp.]
MLAGTVLGSSLAFIDASAVNLTVPVIQQKLGGDFAAAQWIVNAYALLLGALVLAGGAAADRYGRRRVFIAGVALFAVASAACGLSPSLPALIAARALQGVGAAILTPASLALLGATFDEKGRGQAVGIWAGASGLMSAVGPVLGGWLVQTVSWRAVFAINLPLAALAAWLTAAGAKESHGGEVGPVDWRGALAATAGLGLVTWALTDAPKRGADAVILGAGALGAALLAAFLWIEDHAQNPMMPLGLFKSPAFLGLNALTLLLYAAFSGALFVLPFNLLRVHHYPTGAAGAALLPLSVGLAALSPLSGRLAGRIGARFMLLAGGLLAAAGFGLLALRARDGAYWTGAFPGLAVLALGMGVAVAPLTNAVLGAVSQEREGAASGVNNAVARVAGLIAVALAGFVLNGADPASIAAGYRLAMALAAGGAIGAGAIGFLTAGKRTSAR